MEFRILGELDVSDGGHRLDLGGLRPRALVALLLLHANEVVSVDRLVEELWGAAAPASVSNTLQQTVSRLRRTLGPDRIETRSPGYLIRIAAGELDLERFEELVARGDGDSLREALALWRGEPLADFAYEPFAQAAIARLTRTAPGGARAANRRRPRAGEPGRADRRARGAHRRAPAAGAAARACRWSRSTAPDDRRRRWRRTATRAPAPTSSVSSRARSCSASRSRSSPRTRRSARAAAAPKGDAAASGAARSRSVVSVRRPRERAGGAALAAAACRGRRGSARPACQPGRRRQDAARARGRARGGRRRAFSSSTGARARRSPFPTRRCGSGSSSSCACAIPQTLEDCVGRWRRDSCRGSCPSSLPSTGTLPGPPGRRSDRPVPAAARRDGVPAAAQSPAAAAARG